MVNKCTHSGPSPGWVLRPSPIKICIEVVADRYDQLIATSISVGVREKRRCQHMWVDEHLTLVSFVHPRSPLCIFMARVQRVRHPPMDCSMAVGVGGDPPSLGGWRRLKEHMHKHVGRHRHTAKGRPCACVCIRMYGWNNNQLAASGRATPRTHHSLVRFVSGFTHLSVQLTL